MTMIFRRLESSPLLEGNLKNGKMFRLQFSCLGRRRLVLIQCSPPPVLPLHSVKECEAEIKFGAVP